MKRDDSVIAILKLRLWIILKNRQKITIRGEIKRYIEKFNKMLQEDQKMQWIKQGLEPASIL